MRVNVLYDGKTTEEEGKPLEEVLEKYGYTIEGVIFLKEGKVILREDISDEDTIEVMPVASGG